LLAGEPEEEAQRALDWAEVAAMLGDFGEAVAWLDRAEALLQGSLPHKLIVQRREWAEQIH
jgi:hypothetical protein